MRKLKILYYNWTDFEDEHQRGGGVSIYQQNLIDAATQRGDEAWFLSSGSCYSCFWHRPFLREVRSRKKGIRKFEIVNSPFLAPGQEAFGQDVAASSEMENLFADFLREHGPFDVVHFNNLEGIPVSFLRLTREHHPPTKILYSMHNYFAFCPQVNLWFQDRAACYDFHEGRKCVHCLPRSVRPSRFRRFYRFEYLLRKLGIAPLSALDRFLYRFIFVMLRSGFHMMLRAYGGQGLQSKPLPVTLISRRATPPMTILGAEQAARFADRRRLFVTALNTYVDHILAVSRRVAQLAISFGIEPTKVQTLYIGTRFAERMKSPGNEGRLHGRTKDASSPAAYTADSPLPIAYLGYMRRDKGFYFFLKALERMPQSMARRLALTFAVKITHLHPYQRIQRIAHRFASVTFYDGYTHSQLHDILSHIDLAIIPVMWEDNLPQIAMECVASGVPVLTSNRGGAQELLNCPELVFQAGSRTDFYAKLQGILDNPAILSAALAGCARLYTPLEHYDLLREHFYQNALLDGKKEMFRTDSPRPAA